MKMIATVLSLAVSLIRFAAAGPPAENSEPAAPLARLTQPGLGVEAADALVVEFERIKSASPSSESERAQLPLIRAVVDNGLPKVRTALARANADEARRILALASVPEKLQSAPQGYKEIVEALRGLLPLPPAVAGRSASPPPIGDSAGPLPSVPPLDRLESGAGFDNSRNQRQLSVTASGGQARSAAAVALSEPVSKNWGRVSAVPELARTLPGEPAVTDPAAPTLEWAAYAALTPFPMTAPWAAAKLRELEERSAGPSAYAASSLPSSVDPIEAPATERLRALDRFLESADPAKDAARIAAASGRRQRLIEEVYGPIVGADSVEAAPGAQAESAPAIAAELVRRWKGMSLQQRGLALVEREIKPEQLAPVRDALSAELKTANAEIDAIEDRADRGPGVEQAQRELSAIEADLEKAKSDLPDRNAWWNYLRSEDYFREAELDLRALEERVAAAGRSLQEKRLRAIGKSRAEIEALLAERSKIALALAQAKDTAIDPDFAASVVERELKAQEELDRAHLLEGRKRWEGPLSDRFGDATRERAMLEARVGKPEPGFAPDSSAPKERWHAWYSRQASLREHEALERALAADPGWPQRRAEVEANQKRRLAELGVSPQALENFELRSRLGEDGQLIGALAVKEGSPLIALQDRQFLYAGSRIEYSMELTRYGFDHGVVPPRTTSERLGWQSAFGDIAPDDAEKRAALGAVQTHQGMTELFWDYAQVVPMVRMTGVMANTTSRLASSFAANAALRGTATAARTAAVGTGKFMAAAGAMNVGLYGLHSTAVNIDSSESLEEFLVSQYGPKGTMDRAAGSVQAFWQGGLMAPLMLTPAVVPMTIDQARAANQSYAEGRNWTARVEMASLTMPFLVHALVRPKTASVQRSEKSAARVSEEQLLANARLKTREDRIAATQEQMGLIREQAEAVAAAHEKVPTWVGEAKYGELRQKVEIMKEGGVRERLVRRDAIELGLAGEEPLGVGRQVMVPRKSGEPTPGVIEKMSSDGGVALVSFVDGATGKPLQKTVRVGELRAILPEPAPTSPAPKTAASPSRQPGELSQLEYAQWLAERHRRGDIPAESLYAELTRRRELRGKGREELQAHLAEHSGAHRQWSEAFQAHEKGIRARQEADNSVLLADGVLVGRVSENGWHGTMINGGAQAAAEGAVAATPKGYLELPLAEHTPARYDAFRQTLAKKGFRGNLKWSSREDNAVRGDNVVVHGRSIEDMRIAQDAARETYGRSFSDHGVDIARGGYGQSYNNILARAIELDRKSSGELRELLRADEDRTVGSLVERRAATAILEARAQGQSPYARLSADLKGLAAKEAPGSPRANDNNARGLVPRGNPQSIEAVVWHGERGQTNGPASPSGAASAKLGAWFGTSDLQYARTYGDARQYKIAMRRPYRMPLREFLEFDRARSVREGLEQSVARRQQLEQQGYDGIVVEHRDGSKEYILFSHPGVAASQ